jgi:hypothetical protein
LLRLRSIFGGLGDDPDFVTALQRALRDLVTYDPRAVIRDRLAADLPVAA